MSRWSARRAQVEPLAALVAVLALGLALSLYAGAHSELVRSASGADRERAPAALQRVAAGLSNGTVVRPALLESGTYRPPAGVHVRIAAAGEQWTAGPPPDGPRRGRDRQSRLVAVRLGPGRVAVGRLTVEVVSP